MLCFFAFVYRKLLKVIVLQTREREREWKEKNGELEAQASLPLLLLSNQKSYCSLDLRIRMQILNQS